MMQFLGQAPGRTEEVYQPRCRLRVTYLADLQYEGNKCLRLTIRLLLFDAPCASSGPICAMPVDAGACR